MSTAGPTSGPATVEVALAERSYPVKIGRGLLGEAGRLIRAHLNATRAAIVTDANVERHCREALEKGLAGHVDVLGVLTLPPGESTKSFAELTRLCEDLLALGLERRDCVIALGGGVIGDLSGFAAAILRRGVRLVQIPTTLLSQVDSSVGGKTAINSRHGKNLIGAFHQPSLVLADIDVLSTLPAREMRAGYAEVAKYGLLGDGAFFAWLEQNWRQLFGNDTSGLVKAIETSCRMKADIVARDETETGDRMLLNLGHTFGHALEAWAGYSIRLLHGEAVAIGMALAARYSEDIGLAPAGTGTRIEGHLEAVGLPTRLRDIQGPGRPTAAELMGLMAQDKKVQGGKLTLILLEQIGRAVIVRDVETARVERFLERELAY